MRKLAFITSVLMGIAPVALAQPYGADRYDHHDRDDDRHVDESNRQSSDRWVPLAAMDISRNETVDIPRQAGRFRTLRVLAVRGAAYVDFIELRFGNGEQQHVDLHRRIGGAEYADIPLGDRYVEAITVHGRPDRWSRIQVVGMR